VLGINIRIVLMTTCLRGRGGGGGGASTGFGTSFGTGIAFITGCGLDLISGVGSIGCMRCNGARL
jgi:hypothetical protein